MANLKSAGAKKKVWVVTVDMGFGHQRAAVPLKDMAEGGEILTVNNYDGIPPQERNIWRNSEFWYLLISRLAGKGFMGAAIFKLFDKLQRINNFYPRQQTTGTTLQLRSVYGQVRGGLGRLLIKKINARPLPLLTTFFTFGFAAEYWGYKGPIYVLGTDSDLSRAWAPLEPKKSRINYLAPTARAAERLEQYGIPKAHIFYTGFPLPEELVGQNSQTAIQDLRARLPRLDPKATYLNKYCALINSYLGELRVTSKSKPCTILFSVGGAGAQIDTAIILLRSLRDLIGRGEIKLILSAGVSKKAEMKFEDAKRSLNLRGLTKNSIKIIYRENKSDYFREFNEALRKTDILWTKPSELSFYGALGLAIIMTRPVGSQEKRNREWLLSLGAGVDELDPAYANEWLPDLLKSGRLAECAMEGFIKMDRGGTRRITEILLHARGKSLLL